MVFGSACIGRNHLCCGNPDLIYALYKRKQYIFEVGLNLESAAFFFQKRDGGLWIFNIRTVYSHAGQWRKYRDTIELLFPGQFLYFHFAAVWSDTQRICSSSAKNVDQSADQNRNYQFHILYFFSSQIKIAE